jgi:transposase-like protein
MKKTKTPRKSLATRHRSGTQALQYPLDVICSARPYVAYALSLQNLEEVMAERDIAVNHSTMDCWVIKRVPNSL